MFSLIRKCVFLLTPEKWIRWVALILLALLASAFEATGAIIVLLLMGLITGTDQLDLPIVGNLDTVIPGSDRQEQLLIVSGFIALFFLVRAFVMVAEAYWQGRVIYRAGARLSARLLDGYLAMPYEFHLRRNSSEMIRNSYDSVRTFVREVLNTLVVMVSKGMVVVGVLVVLLASAPLAAVLAVLFLGPLTYAMLGIVHPRVKRMGAQSQELSGTSLQTLQQSLGGIRDIKVLGRERPFSETYRRQREGYARAQYRRAAAREIPRQAIEGALMLFVVGFFALTVIRGGSAANTLSILALFGYSALRLKPPLSEILAGLNALKFATHAVDDLVADATLLKKYAPPFSDRATATPLPFTNEIRIEGVTYRYAGTETDVLHDVDFTIRRGESIGIVGPTGGGKSTLVDILMGLLRPTSGRVLVDGVDIAGCTPEWQKNLGVVSQMVFLVDDTLRRNICFGINDDDIDEELLAETIRMAQLDEFVSQLPEGLETMVGERGVRVSGGQRQRIAIARALYHQPSVLVFDEGTSALDNITEREIVAALESLRGHRTIITIAHRLSTIHSCDRVVMLQAGRVSDVGTYEELFHRNIDFNRMAAAV